MPDPTPDQVAAYLDDVQKRYQAFGESDAMPRLLAAVEAALANHPRVTAAYLSGSREACKRCGSNWPCDEYRAISRALLGGE